MKIAIKQDFIKIKLVGNENPLPALIEVSAFLYDFNLLYEYIRLAVDPEYSHYDFNRRFSWTRYNRPLLDSDRLRVVQLRHESPILLVTAIQATGAALAAIWGMLQIAEKIVDWPLDREKKRLELEKLRAEAEKARLPDAEILQAQLSDRHATSVIDGTINRLKRSAIRITDIEVDFVRELPGRTALEPNKVLAARASKRKRSAG